MFKKAEEKIENFTREMDSIQNNQIEPLELKNKINEIKHSVHDFICGLDTGEEIMHELGDKWEENLQPEARRGKRMENREKNRKQNIKTYET